MILAIRVQAGARKTEVIGLLGTDLKIKVASPPVEGAANTALVGFLANLLGLRASQVEIFQGQQSKHKLLKIRGSSVEMVASGLGLAPPD